MSSLRNKFKSLTKNYTDMDEKLLSYYLLDIFNSRDKTDVNVWKSFKIISLYFLWVYIHSPKTDIELKDAERCTSCLQDR